MIRKCFFVAGILFFIGCPASEAQYIYFVNQSGVILQKVEIQNMQNPDGNGIKYENLGVNENFSLEKMDLGFYQIIVRSEKYVGTYTVLLSEQRPSATCCLTPDFRLTHSVSDSVRFQSSSALTRLSARIDTVLEESRRASEDAKNKYAGLIAGYLPGGVRILFNGAELNTEEAVFENIEHFGEFEITYSNDIIKNEINDGFSVIYREFLNARPDPLQNMLEINGLCGASEDEEYLYFEGNAVSKLNFGAAAFIKMLCGISEIDPPTVKGYRNDVSPIWEEGYRYAFKENFSESEKNFFRERLAEWMEVIDNRSYSASQIQSEFEIPAGTHQYNLWHIGCYYLGMIYKKDRKEDDYYDSGSGLSGFPGKMPWQWITLYGKGVESKRIVLHEIGHNLGLMHEHQRWDSVNHLLDTEDSVQWTRLPGNQKTGYDINSVMHYTSIDSGRAPVHDIHGNIAANSGYLSELDKIFISRLYNPHYSGNQYQSPVPVVDRILIKDSNGKNLAIFHEENVTGESFEMSEPTSLKDDVWFESDGVAADKKRIKLIEKGALELPGGNDQPTLPRKEYNRYGFSYQSGYGDKVYYVDARYTNKVDIYIRKFEWQKLSTPSPYKLYHGSEYSIMTVPLTEALNRIEIVSTTVNGYSVKYIFNIIKEEQSLESVRAQLSGETVFEKDSDELHLSRVFYLNYIYNGTPLTLSAGTKTGQTVTVNGAAQTSCSLNLEKNESRRIDIEVGSLFSEQKTTYTFYIQCLDEVAVPESVKITSGDGTVLAQESDVWKYFDNTTTVEILKSPAASTVNIDFTLKENQKIFYSSDRRDYKEMNTAFEICLPQDDSVHAFRVDYDFNGIDDSKIFYLRFQKYTFYNCRVTVRPGGAVKMEDTVITSGSRSFQCQSNRVYTVQCRGATGFRPEVPPSLTETVYDGIYRFQFSGDSSVTVDFPAVYPNRYEHSATLNPKGEKIDCRTIIEGNDLSVNGNTIYLKSPSSGYKVRIYKEEKEGGYLYKNELWLEDNSIVLANKGGTMYNGWVEKEFSGNNVFRRKLYALKAGENLWDISAPVSVFYSGPVF